MSNWKSAPIPTALATYAPTWPYIQWHHGLAIGEGVLADGGFLVDAAKYPGLPLPTVKVRWGKAYAAGSLSVAVLVTKVTWHKGQNKDAEELLAYEEGAWSRLHILAYVAELERTAVITLRSSAAQDFNRELRAFRNGPLALARQHNPTLPECAFWLTIQPGPQAKRGSANTANVTPPTVLLPAPGDLQAAGDWLDMNFVGEELLAHFAQLGVELAYFKRPRNGATEPQPIEPAETSANTYPPPPGRQQPADAEDFPLCDWCGQVYSSPGVPCDQCRKLGAGEEHPPANGRSRRHEELRQATGEADLKQTAANYGLANDPAVQRIIAAALRNGKDSALQSAKVTIARMAQKR